MSGVANFELELRIPGRIRKKSASGIRVAVLLKPCSVTSILGGYST